MNNAIWILAFAPEAVTDLGANGVLPVHSVIGFVGGSENSAGFGFLVNKLM